MLKGVSSVRTLNNLKAFITAAELGSFARAAEQLCVTSAAISQQIKQLEEGLQVKLLERSSTGVQLTHQGREYLPHVKQAFVCLEQGEAKLKSAEQESVFKVAALPSIASNWLMPKVYEILEQHEDVDVRVEASHSKVDFNHQDFDACISFGINGYQNEHKQKLFNDSVCAVASPSLLEKIDSNDMEQLLTLPMIHVDWGKDNDALPSWQDWLREVGLPDRKVAKGPTLNLTNLAVEAAIQGKGLLLGQMSLIQAELKSGSLIKVNDLMLPLKQDYYLVYPQRTVETHYGRRMMALLFDVKL